MKYQIDQSIKIEDTQKASYVCLANGRTIVGSISAADKRELKIYFRKLGKPLIYKLFVFSVLCARVMLEIRAGSVTIDMEYFGHERLIKSFIFQIFQIHNLEKPVIYFAQIGKKSSAHQGAYRAFKQKKAEILVVASQVLRYYEKVNRK